MRQKQSKALAERQFSAKKGDSRGGTCLYLQRTMLAARRGSRPASSKASIGFGGFSPVQLTCARHMVQGSWCQALLGGPGGSQQAAGSGMASDEHSLSRAHNHQDEGDARRSFLTLGELQRE